MADADEATNALIAKMLAEDNPYGGGGYGDHDMYGIPKDDSDDSDWGGGGPKKRKKAGVRGGGRGKAPAAKKEKVPKEPTEIPEFTESGRKKRKDTGVKMRAAPRAWTQEEETKFREALKLFGRDWKQCAAHVGTRDSKAFTSHAQKYFIKLCLQGKMLPAKVRESGDGYTLSGKPLDPNSAAAKAYGFKPDSLQKLEEQGVQLDQLPGLVTGEEGKENKEGAAGPPNGQQAPAPPDEECELPVGAPRAAAPKKETEAAAKKKAKAASEAAEAAAAEELGPPPEPTEYAKARPKRDTAGIRSFLGMTSESLELVCCRDFVGKCGSGGPYSVEVAPSALLVMDLHAHLSCAEVIGFLGGEWDPLLRRIEVKEAFPCRSTTEGEQSRTSCEMDPEAEVEVRAAMEAKDMQVVGWYHSHPVFAPSPSSKDVDNQLNYQHLFHHQASGVAPFVGVIVGPYDVRLPSTASALEVFCTQMRAGEQVAMRVELEGAAGAGAEEAEEGEMPGEEVMGVLRKLVDDFKLHPGSISFSELWRPFTAMEGGVPSGGPVTKLAKMRRSLRRHLPRGMDDEAEEWLDGVAEHIQKSWGVDLGY